MKVILVDNYDREHISDVLHAEGLSAEEAERIADEYNVSAFAWFAKAVPDEYELYKFQP